MFMTKKFNELLMKIGLPNLGEWVPDRGIIYIEKSSKQNKAHSEFLAFAYESMSKLDELNERSTDSKFTASV